MKKPVIRVSVISDVVCPWCYIGKRRLDKALQELSGTFDFEVEYFPFELNSQIPLSGVNQREYLTKKFGGPERYHQLTSHVTKVAASDGLEFNFDKQAISPNTRNAHRLIHLSKSYGKQKELVELFFRAYFTDGVDLSDQKNLVALAAKAGLDSNTIEQYLDSDQGLEEVISTEQQMQKLGISGVPFYIINDKYGISGAQPSEAFIEMFAKIGQEGLAVGGEQCDVEAKNC